MDASLWLALLSGIAVAAACGMRAFLPLLLLGLASRLSLIELRGGAEWLRSDMALLALAVAAVLEIAADKIPVVDHALDAVATLLRPLAAWLGAYAVLQSWPTPWAQIVAVALGTAALGVHAVKAQLRLGSTAATVGHANPVLSVIEDGAALAAMAIAVLAPLLALLVLPVLVLALRRRRHPAT